MMTRAECARWLLRHDDYCILTHRRPDGDTLGSAAVLCRGLRKAGKRAYILSNPEVTEKYAPLLDGLTQAAVADQDTVICVDVAALRMLPEPYLYLAERIALRIDHHFSGDSFTKQELVDHTCGACGEILYDVLTEMGICLDEAMAVCLYTAVATDTGCFRYPNTTAHTLRTAAACYETGAELNLVNLALFDTNSLPRLRIQGWMAENTRFFAGNRLAVCALPLSVEQALGATEDDLDNISGFPRSIEGVKMSATLRQSADGGVKVSVRAVPGYDASLVCARFGGGGHKGAAGCNLAMPLEQAAQALEDVMQELYP